MPTVRLTVAQALVRFRASQYTERDGMRQRLIEGCRGMPVSQTSALDSTRQARTAYEAAQRDQRMYL